MQEAWLQLTCPACEEHWEAKMADLPAPDADFRCRSCDEARPISEFMRTARDLDILRAFHA